jgi:hypothetical protein|tara:strand:- start:15 stop:275 length:261 start_codon:yes stop_codon:yes gene_type:complete
MDNTIANIARYSEYFGLHTTVVENLLEEWEIEQAGEHEVCSFFDYIIDELARTSYMVTAVNGGTVMECLEAYDDATSSLAEDADEA